MPIGFNVILLSLAKKQKLPLKNPHACNLETIKIPSNKTACFAWAKQAVNMFSFLNYCTTNLCVCDPRWVVPTRK